MKLTFRILISSVLLSDGCQHFSFGIVVEGAIFTISKSITEIAGTMCHSHFLHTCDIFGIYDIKCLMSREDAYSRIHLTMDFGFVCSLAEFAQLSS